jgi:mannose-1-phosphate guanylyltransferase
MMLGDIQIAILAGGLGTRLQGVLPSLPKILAPVQGKPFLDYLLEWLIAQGARRVVLCLGYRSADVLSYLSGRSFPPLEILTVVEPEPLGTAGALAHARHLLVTDPVMILNGDTVVDADLNQFLAAHRASGAEISLLAVKVDDAGRYGQLELDADDRVIRFQEKDPKARDRAWINGGMYLCGPAIMQRIAQLPKGSLERDLFENLPPGAIQAWRTHGRFLDIGTPETLSLASEVLTA